MNLVFARGISTMLRAKKSAAKLISLILLTTFFVLPAQNVQAATVTTGDCVVTVNDSTGVNVYDTGSHCLVAFKSTTTSYSWTPPTHVSSLTLLAVGGGGGGGTRHGGGGGAGGLIEKSDLGISNSSLSISVGAGGAAYATDGNGYVGGNTVVTASGWTQTALGGGGGIYTPTAANGLTQINGGSGGGGDCCHANNYFGTSTDATQGNNGSRGLLGGSYWLGGGGGGAGAAATAATGTTAGLGGAGKAINWISSTAADAANLGIGEVSSGSVYFAGGGGGGSATHTNAHGGTPGIGGGGNGGNLVLGTASAATAGLTNTGGGGGGGGESGGKVGGAGGSGVVVIQYAKPQPIDYSLAFNGTTSQYASVNSQIIPATGDFTIELWAKPEAGAPTYAVPVSQGSLGSQFYISRFSNAFAFSRIGGPYTDCGIQTSNGAWTHVAISFSGSNAYCYINGSLAASVTGSWQAIGANLHVGGYSVNQADIGTPWKGALDEVRIYNSTRSEAQIKNDLATYGPTSTASLLAYYDFNEGSGTTAVNQKLGSSASSALTLTGSPNYNDIATTSLNSGKNIVTFERSYLNNLNGWEVPVNVSTAQVLVVGGGGGGGDSAVGATGGGGGAGGYFSSTVQLSGTVPVGVGVAGQGALSSTGQGTTGGDSWLGTLKVGGGGGGNSVDYPTNAAALAGSGGSDYVSGGSGGGGRSRGSADNNSQYGGAAGAHATGGISFQGNSYVGTAGSAGDNAWTGDRTTGGLGGAITATDRTTSISGIATVYAKRSDFVPWDIAANTQKPKTFGSGGSTNYHYNNNFVETTTNSLGGHGAQGLVIISWSNTFTVTFDSNGGSAVAAESVTVGNAVTQPSAPTWGSLTFIGWSTTDGDASALVAFPYTPNGSADFTLYALWAAPVSAPDSITATVGVEKIDLTWLAPVELNGQTVTNYQVEYASASSPSSWTVASSSIPASDRSFSLSGLSASASYYVRIVALTATGQGSYGYPWTKIYSTSTSHRDAILGSIIYDTGYGLGALDSQATNSSVDYTRVRYRMGATYGGAANYVDANFEKTVSNIPAYLGSNARNLTSITNLQIPSMTGTASKFAVQGDVSDLTVLSNVPAVNDGYGFTGRLELWPWNYATTVPSEFQSDTGSSASFYENADSAEIGNLAGYGSFQLHNLTSGLRQTAFAWNRHDLGQTNEIGFGNYSGVHPDWTFCADPGVNGCDSRTEFSLGIFINAALTPNPVINNYTVTYDSKAGSVVPDGSFVTGGAISTAPTSPTKIGFTFAGWLATDGDSASKVTFPYSPGVNSNITLYALWTPVVAPTSSATPAGAPSSTASASATPTSTRNSGSNPTPDPVLSDAPSSSPSPSASLGPTSEPSPEPTDSPLLLPLPGSLNLEPGTTDWGGTGETDPATGLEVIDPSSQPAAVAQTAIAAIAVVGSVAAAAAAAAGAAGAAGAAVGSALGSSAGSGSGSSSGGALRRGDSNSTSGSSQSDSSDDQGSLATVDIHHHGYDRAHRAWGDGLSMWHNKFFIWFDHISVALTLRLAPYSPLFGKLFNDGAYLRAIIGTGTLVLAAFGAELGFLGAAISDGNLLPPTLGIFLAIAVLGVFDAFAGFVGMLTYTLVLVFSGSVDSASEVRLLLGTAIVGFVPVLITVGFRQIRREPALDNNYLWERLTDFAVAPFFAGWTTTAMVSTLPALAGLALPIANSATTFGLIIAATMFLRVGLEEVAARAYPERLNYLHPAHIPDSSARQKIIATIIRAFVFWFVALPFIGICWQLFVGAIVFVIPNLIAIYSHQLPFRARFNASMPTGIPGLIVNLVGSLLVVSILTNVLTDAANLGKLALIFLPAFAAVLAILNVFMQNSGSKWYQKGNNPWFYRISGVFMLLLALRLTGIL